VQVLLAAMLVDAAHTAFENPEKSSRTNSETAVPWLIGHARTRPWAVAALSMIFDLN
jgi:hypothetical protein